jgi:cobalt-zinc-cadmium efflux system membrane fusion protein
MQTEPPYGLPRAHDRVARPQILGALTLAALIAAGLVGCSPKTEAPAPVATNVTLTAAQRQHIGLYTVASSMVGKTVDTTGVVDFDNDQATSVLSPFSGPVSQLLVSPGDHVRKGQPLATVASPDFAAAIGAYRKALTTAETARRLADADKDLLQHNGVSQREAMQAQTDADNAVADRDAALQALAALDVDPQTIHAIQQGRPAPRVEGVIRAPIAGTVAEKLITPGQLLQAGTTPAFTVADLSRVWVMAQVADADLAAIHVGDFADVQPGDATRSFTGTVANLSAQVNPDTRAVLARVVVANPGDLLKKQMYVRVAIHSRQQNTAIVAPTSAVLRDDENLAFVYLVQSDGSFARRHVTLGDRAGDQYAIAQGLRAGDRIVVNGALFLQFMESQ